jgi:hypothetical protein
MFCFAGITVIATVVDAGVTAEETAAAAAVTAVTAATGAALAPVPAPAPEAAATAAAVAPRRRSEMLQVNYYFLHFEGGFKENRACLSFCQKFRQPCSVADPGSGSL